MINKAALLRLSKVKPKFQLGALVMTRSVSELMSDSDFHPVHYVARHVRGDWGDLSDDSKLQNEEHLANGGRLLSSYNVSLANSPEVEKIWVITEHDRSVTTILLPSDY